MPSISRRFVLTATAGLGALHAVPRGLRFDNAAALKDLAASDGLTPGLRDELHYWLSYRAQYLEEGVALLAASTPTQRHKLLHDAWPAIWWSKVSWLSKYTYRLVYACDATPAGRLIAARVMDSFFSPSALPCSSWALLEFDDLFDAAHANGGKPSEAQATAWQRYVALAKPDDVYMAARHVWRGFA